MNDQNPKAAFIDRFDNARSVILRFQLRYGLCWVILGLSQCLPPVSAEPLAEEVPAGAMAGRVVGRVGNPAVGATVWLVGGPYEEDPTAVAKTATDARGRFVFPEARSRHIRPKARRPNAFARDAEGRIGWETNPWTWPLPTPRRDLKIQLVDVQDAHGRIVDAAGRPIADAKVKTSLLTSGSRDDPTRQTIGLFAELVDEASAETAADGSFVLRGVPVGGDITATVQAAGFGSPRVVWDLALRVTIRLDRTGSIRGSLAGPAGAALGGVRLYLYCRSEQSEDADFRVYFSTDVATAEDGTFQFDDVPPGKYVVSPRVYDSELPFSAEPTDVFEVKPGETVAGISLPLKPAVKISGRVVDAATEEGIEGVVVTANHVSEQGRLTSFRKTATDAEGRYVTCLPPGKAIVKPSETPEGYVLPRGRRGQAPMEAMEALAWPVFELEPAVRLEGIVVDDSGEPVRGAEVHVLMQRDGPEMTLEWTDAGGKFSIPRLAAEETLALRARTETAVSDTVHLKPGEVGGPVRIMVSVQKAFVLRGMCRDATGRPIPEARVIASTSWMLGSSGVGFRVSGGMTDAEGRLAVRALWPGYGYELNVTAEGYKKFESARVESRPGQVHDFGKLVLTALGGSVEGRVVDSAGHPIPDVRVFNAGDAAKPVTVRTDASGVFRLEELPTGPVYVFAEKDGYRFSAVRTASNVTGLTIRLLESGEPVPEWKPQRAPPSFDEEQRVARRLLEKLAAAPVEGKEYSITRLMARIDPEQALKWSGEFGWGYDVYVRQTAAETIAPTDSEEALALLAQHNDSRTVRVLLSLAERFLSTDPAKAARFAEEAVLRARNLDQPDRTSELARAGALVVRLGLTDAGRKLTEEAAEMAEKFSTEGDGASDRGIVAAALTPHDFSRAMSLVEPIDDQRKKDDALARVAIARAPEDLDQAVEIVTRLSKRSTLPDNTRLQIAYQLAPTRPDDALRIVEGMDTHGALKIQAEAYGWLAVAIAPHDKPRACSLIDKSMAIYWDDAREFRSWRSYGGRTAMAARVVSQAGQIGYPDMEVLINRVLAMRPMEAEWFSPREIAETSVLTAKILALVDPGCARELLETVQQEGDWLDTRDDQGVDPRDWYQAWGLADFKHSAAHVERRLEAAGDSTDFGLSLGGLVGLLEVLTTPPAERAEVLLHHNGGFWFPGDI